MGNGDQAEYITSSLNIIPKRDALNALKVALDRIYGRECTDDEFLAFVNEERQHNGRRPLKVTL